MFKIMTKYSLERMKKIDPKDMLSRKIKIQIAPCFVISDLN